MISDYAVQKCVVVIKNACYPEVNGEYRFSRFRNNGGEYSRRGMVEGKERVFLIWKYTPIPGKKTP
jgi:hypothetical protein